MAETPGGLHVAMRAWREEPRDQPDGKRTRTTESPLTIFNAWRQHLLADGKYLDFFALEKALRRALGESLPREVNDALGGLKRMMASVNSALNVIFATHHILTLRDIASWVLTSSRDFQGCSTFEQLCLGPLQFHPTVMRYMPHAHNAPPGTEALDAVAVVAHIANCMETRRMGASDALHLLAQSFGLANSSQLPIFVRAEQFVTSLVHRCQQARLKAEQHMEHRAKETGSQAVVGRAAHHPAMGLRERSGVRDHPPQRTDATPLSGCIEGVIRTARQAASTLLADVGQNAERKQLHASIMAAKDAPTAEDAIRELLEEMRSAWRDDAILSWSLPPLSMLNLPLVDAKSLVTEHSNGSSSTVLSFPPVYDNSQRKELHGLAEQAQPQS